MGLISRKSSRVLLALDTIDGREAYRVLNLCHDLIDGVKVNYPLVLREGIEIMKRIKRDFGLSLVADFKVADVPVTNNEIVRLAAANDADAIMVHGFVGSDSIKECLRAAQGRCKVVLVTELTSPGGLEFTHRFARDLAELARILGCDGIQAPGTRPQQVAALRDRVGPGLEIICCGIGAQGGSLSAVLEAGADYGIIGRAIYAHPDPRAAAAGFAAEARNGHPN